MEDMREKMRSVQNQCECFVNEARASRSTQASTDALAVTTRDELKKVQGQLRRAREQVAEHKQAQVELQQDLSKWQMAFSEILHGEADMRASVQLEVSQLEQVVADVKGGSRQRSRRS